MISKELVFVAKVAMILFFMMLSGLVSCDEYESKKSFYLSPFAISPATVKELKNRWLFCEQ